MKVCAQPKNQQKHNRPAACLFYFWIRYYFQPAPSARETYGQPAKAAGLRPAQRAAGIVIDATWQPVKGCFWQKNVFGFFRRPQNVFIIARLFRRQYGLYSLLLRGFYVAIMIKRPSEYFFQTAFAARRSDARIRHLLKEQAYRAYSALRPNVGFEHPTYSCFARFKLKLRGLIFLVSGPSRRFPIENHRCR